MLSVSVVEFAWIAINLTTFVLTFTALFDARADRIAVRALNGHAREVAAGGIVRRELLRLIVQALLLALVVPGLASDREVTLSLPVIVLMSVVILLALQSFLDARERKALTAYVAADVIEDRDHWGAKLERLVQENTVISSEAVAAAEKAYSEANTINQKIAAQQAAGLAGRKK